MDFDFPLTIIVESGQRHQSSATHHPSSMVRDSVSITRETPASWNHHNLQEKRMEMENDQQALSIKDSDINQIGVS